MARIKTTPTPRNSLLSAAMRQSSSGVFPPPSTKPIESEPQIVVKSSTPRPQAVKPAKSLPTTRVIEDRRNITPSQKRKSPAEDSAAIPGPNVTVAKLTLRSNKPSLAGTQKTVTRISKDADEDPPAKRQKVFEPTRRSSRVAKSGTESDLDIAGDTETVPSRQQKQTSTVKIQKKPTRITLHHGSRRHETRPDHPKTIPGQNLDPEPTTTIRVSPLVQSARAETRNSSAGVSSLAEDSPSEDMARQSGSPLHYDVIPPPRLRYDHSGTPEDAYNPEDNNLIKLPDAKYMANLDPAGLPLPIHRTPEAMYLKDPLVSVNFIYRLPKEGSGTPSVVGNTGKTSMTANESVIANDTEHEDADRGTTPATNKAPIHTPYTNSIPASSSAGSPAPSQTPPVSTKGQKVKGKPVSTKPKPLSANGARSKNVANTYPRKQPFKAQIEYPGYPPYGTPIPAHYSMWDICQLMPNALREETLLAFVQREWSANELCACLKDDVRDILNARPGKDKTMVYQKRMERIKKDLTAKGEYQKLLSKPMIREDGRPTWVKRGNVRRK